MKFLIAFVILSLALVTFTLTCANFNCTQLSTPDSCALKTFNGTGLVIKLHACTSGLVCPFQAPLDEEDICATPSNLVPGDVCSNNTQCLSGNCDATSHCVGKLLNIPCSTDIECGVGLYCLNQTCNTLLTIGSTCSDTLKCQVNAACSNSTCVLLASLANGQFATVPAACQSFYIENNTCTQGPTLVGLTSGQTAMSWPTTSNCTFQKSDGSQMVEGCTCGMQGTTDLVCRPGEGDVNMKDVSQINNYYSTHHMFQIMI